MNDRTAFGADTTTDEALEGIDLPGRVALVTGASGGLGAETARALASKGATVTLTARDVGKGEGAAAEIRASTGNDRVDVMELELGSPESIRRFAKEYQALHPSLNLLINNAGVMACPLGRTEQGFELQFGTNHLGHFLLTCLLEPALEKGRPARVVSVSSGGHRFSPIVFDDIQYERRPYDKWEAYGQSKTANVLFAVELDRRLKDRGIRANALHPGGIVTDLGRHLTPEDIRMLQGRAQSSGLKWKQVPAGAATSVWAATAPELEDRGGLYLEDCGIAEANESAETSGGWMPYARDPEAAVRLWRVSEELVGETFD